MSHTTAEPRGQLPGPGGDFHKATTDLSSPSRDEFNRVLQKLDDLSQQVAAANRELAIQFKRMAQLQADIDLIRGAWAKTTLVR